MLDVRFKYLFFFLNFLNLFASNTEAKDMSTENTAEMTTVNTRVDSDSDCCKCCCTCTVLGAETNPAVTEIQKKLP